MLAEIQAAISAGRYFMGPHAGLRQLEREISTEQVEQAFGGDNPEVIKDYPNDPRGHSCLLRGVTDNGEVLHLVCTVEDPVFAVTCYRPDPEMWYPSFRKRRLSSS